MSDAGPEIWRYRRWVVVVVAAVVLVAIVVAMLLLRPDPGGAVLWENYPTGLRDDIEDAAEAGDCETLEALRLEAVETENDQIVETGVGNETLIRFIDDQLGVAGC